MKAAASIALADALEAAASRDLYAAAPVALRVTTREIAGATLLIAPGIPASYFNRVIGLGNAQPARETDMDAINSAYRDAGVKSFWLHVSPGAQPPSLAASLIARGFTEPKRRSWAKFLRDTAAGPGAQTSLAIRPARAADAAAVGAVICTAYGTPSSLAPWFSTVIGRRHWQMFVACDGPRVVGTAALFVSDAGGWLGMAATLEEFRGRGAQSALLSARIAAAAQAGCTVVTTETGEPMGDEPNPSYDNIRRSGFTVVGSRVNYASPER